MSQSEVEVNSDPPSIDDGSTLSVTTVESDSPYGYLPDEGSNSFLGWHITSAVETEYGQRVILLSDPCVGEPPIDEVVKVVSHEYLHDILEEEIGRQASCMLDNIVHDGSYVANREENNNTLERELRPKYRD